MTAVVGVFDRRDAAVAAELLLDEAGFGERISVRLRPCPTTWRALPVSRARGETMLRAAVKWAVLGSLIVELPSLVAIMLLPIDLNVKILLAAHDVEVRRPRSAPGSARWPPPTTALRRRDRRRVRAPPRLGPRAHRG